MLYVHDWCMYLCVEIWQVSVSHQGILLHNVPLVLGEHGWVLVSGPLRVVIAHEGVERAQLHPSRAQLTCRVANEPTNIST